MDKAEEQETNSYYSILGLENDASKSSIRHAYIQQAMKWHPDKCALEDQAEANLKFQQLQEAYTVLSDSRKKALYDIGLYDPDNDEEEIEAFSDFIDEMAQMMSQVQETEKHGKGTTIEDLQQLFFELFSTSDVPRGASLSCGSSGFSPSLRPFDK